jgi:cyclohexa-1,5-dienecarbonyl-CoA hydratase
LELLLTGAVIEAAAAEKMGLINKVFPTEGFRERVNEFIAALTAFSAPVLKLTKRAVDQTLAGSVAAGISTVERIYLAELMRTADAHEGIAAFLEKRPPAWQDK